MPEKGNIKLATTIYIEEDPDLVAILLPLSRGNRSRRVRALLRAGLNADQAVGATPSNHTAPSASAPPCLPASRQPHGAGAESLHHVDMDFSELSFTQG